MNRLPLLIQMEIGCLCSFNLPNSQTLLPPSLHTLRLECLCLPDRSFLPSPPTPALQRSPGSRFLLPKRRYLPDPERHPLANRSHHPPSSRLHDASCNAPSSCAHVPASFGCPAATSYKGFSGIGQAHSCASEHRALESAAAVFDASAWCVGRECVLSGGKGSGRLLEQEGVVGGFRCR